MNVGTLQCPSCRKAEWTAPVTGEIACPTCEAIFDLEVFPALERPLPKAGGAGQALVAGDEAGCFYHPGKKAVVPCDACGRFLCALCDLEIGDAHLCPACLEKGRTAHTVAAADGYRMSYPDLALLLALLPMVLWPVTIATAPAALFVAIRGWNKPPSLTGRKKRLRSVIAIVFASLQIVAWGLLFVAMFNESLKLFQ